MKIYTSKIWFWAFITLLLLNITAFATMFYRLSEMRKDFEQVEQMPPPPGPRPPMRFNSIIQKQAGYSSDQLEQLQTLRLRHLEKMQNHRMTLRETQEELFEEVAAENPNPSRMDSLKHVISNSHANMIDESVAFYESVKTISTPEQLRELNKYYRNQNFNEPNFRGNRGNPKGRHENRGYRNNFNQ
ncbi:MAG: hypothetical protein JXR34_06810 [Bacteroidales bacterium]|nr:hypothetical protein [Bacteroidales bacterium]